MQITLTANQWQHLKKIVTQGKRSENALSKPVEISNADVSIEIKNDEVKIVLPD